MINFGSATYRFESHAEFAGLKGSMISFPFLYLEAVLPYLANKAVLLLSPQSRGVAVHKLHQVLASAYERLHNPELLPDISLLSENHQRLYKESHSMFSLFPEYDGSCV